MKSYVVGGAVRDELLGLPVRDRDHVVVGATPQEMEAAGFRPVGKDFPVFLHPRTHEEYALARTERKSGRGYKGFVVHASPEVTLEEDLRRRDVTINAMAREEDGALIDPFGGEKDLRAKVLRHVSAAFAEDPVRILRVARFAARFGFTVHPETMALMREMVASGEADFLVPERVWQELSKGLAEPRPERMFDVLRESGLLDRAFPELHPPSKFPDAPVATRFAVLAWPLPEAQVQALCARLRVPNEVADLALLAVRNRDLLARAAGPDELLSLIKSADALRRPERFAELLRVARFADPAIDTARLERAARAAQSVDAGAIARSSAPAEVANRVDEARRQAIARADG
ncbi:MAG: multifunctional CCA tRNA nucleotidyl transferase/2'3'-cyclic phosphodiesterase/2'nucleotidase/phosphatase [Betaproteobacteria bacterium]|nr:multifunctional CCA tRNA nucleotidyl transferase/2'3'-cyclic phosphodiesterase/2'nucleotidase/phosphatase [Betaproteobacteria bacterium]